MWELVNNRNAGRDGYFSISQRPGGYNYCLVNNKQYYRHKGGKIQRWKDVDSALKCLETLNKK